MRVHTNPPSCILPRNTLFQRTQPNSLLLRKVLCVYQHTKTHIPTYQHTQPDSPLFRNAASRSQSPRQRAPGRTSSSPDPAHGRARSKPSSSIDMAPNPLPPARDKRSVECNSAGEEYYSLTKEKRKKKVGVPSEPASHDLVCMPYLCHICPQLSTPHLKNVQHNARRHTYTCFLSHT